MKISRKELASLAGKRVAFVTNGKANYRIRVEADKDRADVCVRVVGRSPNVPADSGLKEFEWNVVGLGGSKRVDSVIKFVDDNEDFSVCFVVHGIPWINPDARER